MESVHLFIIFFDIYILFSLISRCCGAVQSVEMFRPKTDTLPKDILIFWMKIINEYSIPTFLLT